MNNTIYLQQLEAPADETSQITAVKHLQTAVGDDRVFGALCTAALQSPHAKVREHIIAALQPRAAEANRWFVMEARETRDPAQRRLALVSLSLMGCRSAMAREAAIKGLNDPDQRIQYAAALNIGFFDDPQFLIEAARFLERNRFVLACTGGHRMLFNASRQGDGLHHSSQLGRVEPQGASLI